MSKDKQKDISKMSIEELETEVSRLETEKERHMLMTKIQELREWEQNKPSSEYVNLKFVNMRGHDPVYRAFFKEYNLDGTEKSVPGTFEIRHGEIKPCRRDVAERLVKDLGPYVNDAGVHVPAMLVIV